MHVFHVITTLNKGGAESHLVDLCRAVRERGVRLTVAYLKGDAYWVPEMRAMGVETVALEARSYADPAAVWRLARAIRRARPDLIHAHMPPADLFANLARRLGASAPYMVSKHNDEPFYRGPGAGWLARQCAKPAKSIICISRAVHDYFASQWPASLSRKLVTVPYGLTPRADGSELDAAARALRAEWGIGEDEIVFGIAARFVDQKAIDTLIAAFALVASRTHRKVRLALVGRGELEPQLRAQAEMLEVGDKVIWPGFRTDIPVVMRAFDAFVLSSIFEGFGLVLLEAMEASTPIIASRVSAIPEVVADGDTGLLVPPREPEQLAAAMQRLLDPNLREAMGAAGHRRLREVFSVDKMAEATLAIYRSLVGAPAAVDAVSSVRVAGSAE